MRNILLGEEITHWCAYLKSKEFLSNKKQISIHIIYGNKLNLVFLQMYVAVRKNISTKC